MKFGIRNTPFVYPNGTGISGKIPQLVSSAEKDGLDSFWFKEHFYQFTAQGSPFACTRESFHPAAVDQPAMTDNVPRRGVCPQRFQNSRGR